MVCGADPTGPLFPWPAASGSVHRLRRCHRWKRTDSICEICGQEEASGSCIRCCSIGAPCSEQHWSVASIPQQKVGDGSPAKGH